MVCSSIWTLAWAAAAIASSAWAAVDDSNEAPSNVHGDAFIVECNTHQDMEPLVDAIQQLDGQVSRRFESDIFYGVSVRLANATAAGIQKIQGVKNTWPMEVLRLAEEEGEPEKRPEVQQPGRRRLGRRAAGEYRDSRWHHVMTQVDKLHAEGTLGAGIKIAVIDTGVNYTHPALGGCFGQGCRVAMGDNLTKDGKRGDPMDCTGHGTATAGVLAGDDQETGFVGVAPRATLAAYRVLDCNSMADVDDIVAGWLKAYEDGAQIIVSSTGISSSGWASSPMTVVASRIAAKGVSCIVGLGNDGKRGLFSALEPATGQGVIAVNSFASKSIESDDGSAVVKTAGMSRFSTSGPTWNLAIKPNVGAPGDDIPCPKAEGGYHTCSGTSYSGPQVAGMVALMAERRRSLDPVLLNSLLMATAELQEDGDLMPVVQQGGGLVRAWDAAHATTVLEPASLAFNDTDHRHLSIGLRITNTAESEVVYDISDVPARTLYAHNGYTFRDPESVQAAARIKLSKSSITLGPGQSATVDVSAEDPEGLDQNRLPVWSGWVSVNGSDGKSLTIPYLGLAGSLRDQRVLESWGAAIAYLSPGSEKHLSEGAIFYYETKDGALTLSVPLLIKTLLGSPLVRAEIVPVSPQKWLAERLGDRKSLPAHGFPKEGHKRHDKSFFIEGAKNMEWDGQLQWGDYLPFGDYKFVVRALRIFGDANVESDWDTAESTMFRVAHGAGEEACKIYQPGKSEIPEGSLFASLEECLQTHGKILADNPWVPKPRDESVSDKCSDENPTEEACGTYRYCNAHHNGHGFRSPFRYRADCLLSHKFLPSIKGTGRLEECVSTKDKDICGTELWCWFNFGSAQPTGEYSSNEECRWAHGLHGLTVGSR